MLACFVNGLEVCPVNKFQIRSLEYVLNNTFKRIFATKSFDVANECVLYFWCAVQETLCKRKSNFFNEDKVQDYSIMLSTPVSEMTYTVSSGTLNSTIPYLYKNSRQTNLPSFRN